MGATKQQIKGPPATDPFHRETTTLLLGRTVRPKMELTVRGVGKVRFHAVVTNPATGASWLDVYHVHRGQWRSVSPEQVTAVGAWTGEL